MARNLGDRAVGSTIDFKFNTHDTDGAPITLAGTPSLACYKGNSTTEDTDGITLSVDFDSRTGMHNVRIDTSSDGTFYSSGGNFQVVLTAGTVDSISVAGVVVAEFTLGLTQTAAAAAITAAEPMDVNVTLWKGATPSDLETSADVAAAVWDEDLTGHTTTDTAGEALTAASEASGMDAAGIRTALGMASANMDTQLSGIQSDTNDIQARLPASLVSGRMDSSVGAMANNVMTAAAAASDLTTELQSGLATASALATVDTVVDAIKTKTDSLTFTVAGQVDANAQSMNGSEILGDGTSENKWRGGA